MTLSKRFIFARKKKCEFSNISRKMADHISILFEAMQIFFISGHIWNMQYRYGILVFKKDIDMLENEQHRATILVPGLKNESNEVRLKEFKPATLEIRQKWGDLIEFYKILNGLDTVEWKNNLVKSGQENTDNLRREGWVLSQGAS